MTDKLVTVRFPREVVHQLKAAANGRMVTVNSLVNRAVADFLDRLGPVVEDEQLP